MRGSHLIQPPHWTDEAPGGEVCPRRVVAGLGFLCLLCWGFLCSRLGLSPGSSHGSGQTLGLQPVACDSIWAPRQARVRGWAVAAALTLPVSWEHKGQEPPQIAACCHLPNPNPVYPELAEAPVRCTSQVGPGWAAPSFLMPHSAPRAAGLQTRRGVGPWRKGSQVCVIWGGAS